MFFKFELNTLLLTVSTSASVIGAAISALTLHCQTTLKIQWQILFQWVPGVESFEPIDNSPMQVGKHFTEVQSLPIYGKWIF